MKKILFMAIMAVVGMGICEAGNRVLVNKSTQRLCVVSERGDTLLKCSVSTGKNRGNKVKRGDMRTPEGTFSIQQIQDASAWTHDFGDGAGQRKGAYGPYFLRLKTPPHSGIGIHGTCFPELLGTASSEGCIRLSNENLRKLVKLVKVGTQVTVEP